MLSLIDILCIGCQLLYDAIAMRLIEALEAWWARQADAGTGHYFVAPRRVAGPGPEPGARATCLHKVGCFAGGLRCRVAFGNGPHSKRS